MPAVTRANTLLSTSERIIVLLCACCLFVTSIPAAEAAPVSMREDAKSDYLIQTWQTEEGLPQNSVTCIAQTPDGYLWLGTFNGLVRFDGARFVVFDAVTTPELESSRIVELHADLRGRLWILTEFGDAVRFEGGRFTSLRKRLGKVTHLVEDLEGRIWFTREKALERLDDGSQIPLAEDDGTGFGWIRTMTRDSAGSFWAMRKGAIGVSKAGQFQFSRSLFGSSETPDQIGPARDGGMWVWLKSSGLSKYRNKNCTAVATNCPVPAISPKTLFEDTRGNIWMGTEVNGLFRYGTNGQWEVFGTTNGLSHQSIRSVYEDLEGNIWAGTDGGGLNRLTARTFTSHGAHRGVALTITEDRKGGIWVGFNGDALQRMDGGQFAPMTYPPILAEKGAIWSVFADRQGDVWTGDLRGGLLCAHDKMFERHSNPGGDPILFLRALFEDRAGAIWAGHIQGLLRYQYGSYTRFDLKNGLPSLDVRAFAENGDDDLFIGTNGGGLARYRGGHFKVYSRSDGLADDHIWSLYEDSQGTLWIGTFGSGLSRFRDEKCFNYRETLPATVVSSIIEDDFGNLWFGSLKGIFRVSIASLNSFADGKTGTLVYQHYDKSDGLGSVECSGGLQPAAWKAHDGKLWFATLKGVCVVDPARVPFNAQPPRVVIEETLVDDRSKVTGPGLPANPGQTLRVPAGSARLEFRYTAFNFRSAEKLRFKHRLTGLDRDWIDAGTRRTAPYMHVPSGRYEFRVIACNSDGIWNEAGAALAVIVAPFFWQTNWFRFASAATIVLLGWGFYRRRVAQFKRLHAVQQEFSRRLIDSQEKERNRIAAELHDSVGQNLLFIKNRAELAMDPRWSQSLPEQLTAISSAASRTIEEVREISHNLRPYQLGRLGLTKAIQAVVDEVSRSSVISFQSEIEAIDGVFTPEGEINLYRIVQECLNNIVKHSHAHSAQLVITRSESGILLKIRDDGIGFDLQEHGGEKSRQRDGMGLASLTERVRILGGQLNFDSSDGNGTRVDVQIPLPGSPQ